MYLRKRIHIVLFILLLGLAPLAASCSPFGDDEEDDEALDTGTPTVAIAESPETDDTPEADEEADAEETTTDDPPETPPKPVPGEETPEGTPQGTAEGTPEGTSEGTPEGSQQGTPEATQEVDLLALGEDIFTNVCAACHQAEGEGIEGIYPALAGNQFVTLEDPKPVIQVVLTGRGGMPRFAGSYTNEEIAGIVSYIRTAWENDASEVDPATVQEVRDSLQDAPEDESETGGEQTEDTS